MEIQFVDPNNIKADPKQPRHFFDMARIKEMAKSILTEGVINPIEVDRDFIIITGEMRWRASKEAGLEEIPVKIVDIDEDTRFRRQTIENIHHNTMTAMETAEALEKLLSMANGVRDAIGYGNLTKLSKEIGKSDRYIQDHLNLLKQSDKTKEYLSNPKGKMSLIREIDKYAPDEYKEELKEKVADGKINNYRVATELSRALGRDPSKAQNLMSQDWSTAKDGDVGKIHDIVPEDKFLEHEELGVEISRKMTQLILLLKKVDKTRVYTWEREAIKRDTGDLMSLLKDFNNTLLLEGRVI